MATPRDKQVLNIILNPLMPTNEAASMAEMPPEDDFSSLPNYAKSREAEIEGIRFAEQKEYSEAVAKFDEAIRHCPQNPSAFNNRGQTYQLMKRLPEALEDLNKSLELCGNSGRTAAQAFAQRGLIHRLQGNLEAATSDYRKAADLGSKFAKMELTTLNPYAAMCNQMLGEVMEKLQQPQ